MGSERIDQAGTVFVWRGHPVTWSSPSEFATCPMCNTGLLRAAESHEYEGSWGPGTGGPGVLESDSVTCPLCGWSFSQECDTHGYYNTPLTESRASVLRQLDLNSDELEIAELATHLQRHASHLFGLSPKRFERLITGVFSRIGFDAVHTGRSGDGGADIVLFKEGRSERWGIVECKLLTSGKAVQPIILRALVGAAVDFNVRKAYLVTTGTCSAGLMRKLDDFRARGYEIDLLQATEILRLLGVYHASLPSLDVMTEAVRTSIIAANTEAIVRS